MVRLSTVNAQQIEDLNNLRQEIIEARSEARSSGLQLAEIRARLEETERAFAEKEALFRQTGESLKKEFQLKISLMKEIGSNFTRQKTFQWQNQFLCSRLN